MIKCYWYIHTLHTKMNECIPFDELSSNNKNRCACRNYGFNLKRIRILNGINYIFRMGLLERQNRKPEFGSHPIPIKAEYEKCILHYVNCVSCSTAIDSNWNSTWTIFFSSSFFVAYQLKRFLLFSLSEEVTFSQICHLYPTEFEYNLLAMRLPLIFVVCMCYVRLGDSSIACNVVCMWLWYVICVKIVKVKPINKKNPSEKENKERMKKMPIYWICV